MPIKINSTGGGSVSIDVPSTGGTYTLTAPANNAAIFTTDGGAITGNVGFSGAVSFASNNVSIAGQTVSPYGAKNKIINGAMQIWQRATTYTATPNQVYGCVDRWFFYSAASMTASQSTSVPSAFQYSLKIQRPASAVTTNSIYATQIVETVNMLDLVGQQVTLSFWAKAGANFSASSSNMGIYLFTGTVADQGSSNPLGGWTGSSTVINSSQAITTTWTRYTFTATIPSNALELNVSLYFTPTGTAGADDSVYITGVQLEAGPVATPFEFRQIGTELALCQRYYSAVSSLFYDTVGSAYNGLTQTRYAYHIGLSLPVQQRSSPTITYSMNVGPGTDVSANFASTQNDGRYIRWRNAGSGFATTGDIYVSYTASAEL